MRTNEVKFVNTRKRSAYKLWLYKYFQILLLGNLGVQFRWDPDFVTATNLSDIF